MSRPRVPLADLHSGFADTRAEVERAIARVLSSQQFVQGPEVEAFEADFARACGAAFACGCGSGSDALLLALMALDVGPGDEVLCPAYSFIATAAAIVRLGARPVFADIDPITYNLDVERARPLARSCERLRAVIPVHLFGQVADLEACRELANEHDAVVLEDAAQAVAAADAQGHRCGSRSRLACFSFYPSKNLGAFGEAGAVVTSDAGLAERIRRLRSHGAEPGGRHPELGINSRLDALQAAILRAKLPLLETWTAARGENAAAYDRAFTEAGAVPTGTPLGDAALPLAIPKRPAAPARHAYHHYAVRVPAERRDALRASLAARGIETGVFYPIPLHRQPCFAAPGGAVAACPAADAATRESLALPVHPGLAADQLEQVIEAVVGFLAGTATGQADP